MTERTAAITIGEEWVEPLIKDDAYSLDEHSCTEGICHADCRSYTGEEDGIKRCKAFILPIKGIGHPCIPWLRWSRYMFERMFAISGCPASDNDPIEWLEAIMHYLKEEGIRVEWLLRKLIDHEEEHSGCGTPTREIRKKIVHEMQEVVKEKMKEKFDE